MRKRAIGLIMTTGLFVGAMALPASAAGACQNFGLEWGAFGQTGDAGAIISALASNGDPGPFPVEGGPGVMARIVIWEMDNLYCTD